MVDSQAKTIIEDLLWVAERHLWTVPTQTDAILNARAYLAATLPPPDTATDKPLMQHETSGPRVPLDSKWQPITTGPSQDVVYLFGEFQDGTPWWNIGFQTIEGYWLCGSIRLEPSHWMPLPAPPVALNTKDADR